ncbi:MAG: helix-turn-helix domain-containing protein [Rickettsiales bacterium]
MNEKDEVLEITRGSGNVYADFGVANPQIAQLKARLAAEIIKTLDARKMTVRSAHAHTGIAAADFSRIRNAKLGRFTVDRLMMVLAKLDRDVNVKVTVRPHGSSGALARL